MHLKTLSNSPGSLTILQKNIATVKEYMSLAYSPKENKGRSTVAHVRLHPNSS